MTKHEAHNGLAIQMTRMEQQAERDRLLQPTDPWPKPQATAAAVAKRLRAAERDFWRFDADYFAPEMYSGGYAPAGWFQEKLASISEQPGVQIVLAARIHAKTATAKKKLVRDLLTGRIMVAGTYSQTINGSSAILDDVYRLIIDNPKITHDYGIEWIEANSDRIVFRVTRRFNAVAKVHTCYVRAFSEGVSVRGYSPMFSRPQFILADDIETRTSPLGSEQTMARISALAEAHKSLDQRGTVLVMGNNFDRRCAMNLLKQHHEQGILASHWKVHVYPAWGDYGALWPQRYPAKTEAELRAMLQPADETEWQGDFQQNPVPPDGVIFSRGGYAEYDSLPDDVRGVMWVDPNLAKKSKGDRSAIVALGYSPTTHLYYVIRALMRSYASSFKLLNDVLTLKADLGRMIVAIGWDGNVNQESTWTDHIRNWSAHNKHPFPRIGYRNYRVDDLAKNAQGAWDDGQILMPAGYAKTTEGAAFMEQIFSFAGKKAGRPDDAPDALISAFELLHERKLVRRRQSTGPVKSNVSITDIYSF